MQTIGERLEEARKKLGLGIEQAAAATKIRAEYLVSLEKSSGDEIPLQEIYVRGFIRNYGKFLKLETSRLVADFDATRRTRATSRGPKDVIGRLELAGAAEAPVSPTGAVAAVVESSGAFDGEESFLKKLPSWAIPSAIGLVSLLLMTGIVSSIVSCARQKSNMAAAAASVSPIKIYASGDVMVTVQDATTSQNLFGGTLKKGDERTIEASGEVLIKYSNGSLLEVEKDGKRYKMATSGPGKRVFK